MRSLLLVLILIVVWTAGASDPDLPFMEYLDQNRLVCLEWGFDSQKEYIMFRLTVNTTGWVGFGLSPNGGMAGADIVMGGLGPSGSYFKDYHATGLSMPLVDEQQSYTLLSASESDGQTILTFKRTIQSCDDQDFHITTAAIKLIYAYGTTDEISYHSSRRGTREVNLLNYMPRVAATGDNFLRVTVDNISVPEKETYYHCKVMKISNFKTKHHVYLIEPLIEHHDLIHHMLLYRCPPAVTLPLDEECYTGAEEPCFEVVASWAAGGGVYVLPNNAGIPFGGEDSEILYRLEIHYNNPNNDKGRTDSSGLKLYYTDKLREHDVATLMTGLLHLPGMDYKIPPKVAQFHSYGVCNTSAFSQLVKPLPDLHVFAVLMHTHLAGRKVRVGHYRNQQQIDFLDVNENYQYEYQQAVSLGAIKTIKPGDEIVVECTYSTATRSKVTKFGLGTYDEMCLAFLLYYPAVRIATCISHPNVHYISPGTDSQIFGGTTPSQDEIAEYERLLKTVPQFQVVSSSDYNHSVYEDGFVREMMNTPTVDCRNNVDSGSSRLGVSWMLGTAGITFSLLLVVIL
ncbi:DBH-like monooxygenase protein 2 homolog [Halichoeres trimaculatus]|uniref:DBH-like monooxygenase protein 2 homolog n=1 Tax=Halichoeres trimaculatus TaxID=147232 RepID=UPI003D9DDB0A